MGIAPGSYGRRRGESFGERVWKFRGVIAVASVPVFLILAVVLLMPRAPTDHLDFSHHGHLPQSMHSVEPHTTREVEDHPEVDDADAHAAPDAIDDTPVADEPHAPASDGKRYAVVFDAGSTGSRVHVFRFDVDGERQLALVDDTFEQLKPGLSSHAAKPKEGAASLKPLLAIAMKTVPEAQRATTTVEVRATAGLRMLPGGQADALLQAVRDLLSEYPFKHTDDSVSIMDGAEEGAFQWLTMNYLLGNLAGGIPKTVATVDLGGGSVQLAYAIPAEAAAAPDGYTKPLKGGGVSYDVYVHSHLGYGLMAARAAVLGKAAGKGSPCIPDGHEGEYTYGGKTHAVKSHSEGASADACKEVAEALLDLEKACDPAPKDECSFAGAWGGGAGAGAESVYLSSYLYDRASQTGIVGADAISGATTPSKFYEAAAAACKLSVSEVAANFEGVEEKDAPYLCMDLSYQHSLITKGFKLQDGKEITMVKQIEYKGQNIEAAWPLGAAINSMS